MCKTADMHIILTSIKHHQHTHTHTSSHLKAKAGELNLSTQYLQITGPSQTGACV